MTCTKMRVRSGIIAWAVALGELISSADLLSQTNRQIPRKEAIQIGRAALAGVSIPPGWQEKLYEENDHYIYTFDKKISNGDRKYRYTGGLYTVYINKTSGTILGVYGAQ